MEKQKILILTANFGGGHTTVANSIKKYLMNDNLSLFKDYEIIIENFIEISNKNLDKTLTKLYETNVKYTPFLYNTYYHTMKEIDSKYTFGYPIYLNKLNS